MAGSLGDDRGLPRNIGVGSISRWRRCSTARCIPMTSSVSVGKRRVFCGRRISGGPESKHRDLTPPRGLGGRDGRTAGYSGDGASRWLAYSRKLAAASDRSASVQHRIKLGAGSKP